MPGRSTAEPPMESLFRDARNLRRNVDLLASQVTAGALILVRREEPLAWYDVALAAAVAGKAGAAMELVPVSGASGSLPPGMDNASRAPATTPVLVCAAWVDGTSSSSLRVFFDYLGGHGIQVAGLLSIRFEKSAATAWLPESCRLVACSAPQVGQLTAAATAAAEDTPSARPQSARKRLRDPAPGVAEAAGAGGKKKKLLPLDTSSSTAGHEGGEREKEAAIAEKEARAGRDHHASTTGDKDSSGSTGSDFLFSSCFEYKANEPIEDRHADRSLGPAGHIFCVMDGHGGVLASQFVADHLLDEVAEELRVLDSAKEDEAADETEAVQVALKRAFQSTESAFRQELDTMRAAGKVVKTPGIANAGACVVLVLMRRGYLYTAHVGDCRAIIASKASASAMTEGSRKRSRAAMSKFPRGLEAIPLTTDHNCYNPIEVDAVRSRCPNDRNAIRASRNDMMVIRQRGGTAIKRVAGSLAVTRAIGDVYLKDPRYAPEEFRNHVPYITAEAETSARALSEDDCFVVLASDGIWEISTNEDVVGWAADFLARKLSDAPPLEVTISQEIAAQALANVASQQDLSVSTLAKLKHPDRRKLHDDITCMVVVLRSAESIIGGSIAAEEGS